jgi:hypothetical protein
MSTIDVGHCSICDRPYNWCDMGEKYTCAECRKSTCCVDMIECGGNFGQCKRSICRNCWNKRISRNQVCPKCKNFMGYSKSKHMLYHS